MTEETLAGSGAAEASLSPVEEVTEELTHFAHQIKGLEANLQSRLQQQEERVHMLERKTLTAARPALSGAATEAAPHQKAFNAYLRTGDDDALRGLELEEKALSTAVAADGGYLVDPQTSDTVQSVLKSQDGRDSSPSRKRGRRRARVGRRLRC